MAGMPVAGCADQYNFQAALQIGNSLLWLRRILLFYPFLIKNAKVQNVPNPPQRRVRNDFSREPSILETPSPPLRMESTGDLPGDPGGAAAGAVDDDESDRDLDVCGLVSDFGRGLDRFRPPSYQREKG